MPLKKTADKKGKRTAICRETAGEKNAKVNKLHRSSAYFNGRIATCGKTACGVLCNMLLWAEGNDAVVCVNCDYTGFFGGNYEKLC